MEDGTAQDNRQAFAICSDMYEEDTKARANTLANLLSAKLHEAFTKAADEMAMRGYLDQPQRIEISSAIGDMLRSFNSDLEPELAAMVIDAVDVHEIANKAGVGDQHDLLANVVAMIGQDEKQVPGLYLADPHGPLVWDEKKTAIAKAAPAELAGTWVLVGPGFAGAADPGKAYGIVTLSEAEKVTLEDFDQKFDQHRVTVAERKRWWKNANQLYLHHIESFERWDPPKEVRVPENVRDEIPELEFTGNKSYVYRRPAKDTVLAKEAVTLAGNGQDIELIVRPEVAEFDDFILEAMPPHPTGSLTIADKASNGKAQPVADLVLRWRRGQLVQDDKAHFPTNAFGLTALETFGVVRERGEKFSQPVARYRQPAENPREVCGACRFYERNPAGGALGTCSVVAGDIAWFGTSDYFIAAEDEAIATFAATGALEYVNEQLNNESSHNDEYTKALTEFGNVEGETMTTKQRPFKTVNGVRLNAGDFASVGDPQEPGTWKLPLTKTPGGVDAGRIADAITAMQPGGFRGQRVQLTAPKAQVVRKISAAIGKLDDEDAQERLRGRLDAVKSAKAGRRMSGERANVLRTVRDELAGLVQKVQDVVGWADYEDRRPWVPFQAVKTYTTKDGRKGVILWTTNAFIDRDEEIFTTKAIDDYVQRHADNDDKGGFWFWHIPGSKFATIKAQGMVGRFLVEAGPFDDTKVGQAFQRFFEENPNGHPKVAPEGWGASHGYVYDPEDRKDGVYDWFEKRESSVLPGSVAANPFNPSMEVYKVDAKQEAAFRQVVGDDELVDDLLNSGQKLTDVLEAQGVAHKQRASESEDAEAEDTKEGDGNGDEQESAEASGDGDAGDAEAEAEPEAEAEAEAAPVAEGEKDYATVAQFNDMGEAIKIMATQIGTLTDTVQALVATDDERIQEQLENTPAASLKDLTAKSVKGSAATRLRKDSKLAKSGPEEADPIEEGDGMGIPVLNRLKALNQRGRSGGD